MKLLLIGGGTGGPTTTLLAIAEHFQKRHPQVEYIFLADRSETTRKFLAETRIPFITISAGKFRRYWSIHNIIDFGRIGKGFVQAQSVLSRFRPNGVLSCGSYVAPPVIAAAWLRHIPVYIHQQDVMPGLSNRLSKPFAKHITVSFQESLKYFPSHKTSWTGNPVRTTILEGDKTRGYEYFHLKKEFPVTLILGGGTCALGLNQCIEKAAHELLTFTQIIHVTGKGKAVHIQHEYYRAKNFLNLSVMADALQIADVIISLAGLGAITECATVKKAPILVPLPYSHQEINAAILANNMAALHLSQEKMTTIQLVTTVQKMLTNTTETQRMGTKLFELLQPQTAGDRIAVILAKMFL